MQKIVLLLILFLAISCKKDDFSAGSVLETESVITYNAMCQTDDVRFSSRGKWWAKTDCEWITLSVDNGVNGGVIPLYIQQNDCGVIRKANLIINTEDGEQLKVEITQISFDVNSGIEINLASYFGLGWGYDYTTDHADVSGLRGQVFDWQLLKNALGDNVIGIENITSTHLYYASEHTLQNLQKKMSSELIGEVDLKIAGARVSTEFSKQIEQQRECLMVWSRDCKYVKQAYLSNLIDLYDEDDIYQYLTWDFKNAVKVEETKDFVRKYGTHLVVSSFLGGRLDYFFSVSNEVTTETTELITSVTAKFLFWKKQWTSKEQKIWQEVKSEFEGNFYVAGGGYYEQMLNAKFKDCIMRGMPLGEKDVSLLDNWQACFENPTNAKNTNLTMIDFNVIPIWEPARSVDPDKAEQIKNYIESIYMK